jgi:5-methylcytosine-specific restriction endonuclease McrA
MGTPVVSQSAIGEAPGKAGIVRTIKRRRRKPQPISPERLAELERLPYKQYLKTREWQRRRWGAIKRAGGKCSACGSREALQVHHTHYHDPRGMEAAASLVVLCDSCHRTIHMLVE